MLVKAQLNLFMHFYVCTHIGMEFELEKRAREQHMKTSEERDSGNVKCFSLFFKKKM